MLKGLAIFTAAVTALALAGCDAGKSVFTKTSDPSQLNQVVQVALHVGEDCQ